MKLLILLIVIQLIYTESAYANFHAVGWGNTVLPGAGRLMMGEYLNAAKEASLEVGTFELGYSLSHQGAFSLDGTAIEYPSPTPDNSEKDASKPITSAFLQEFGIKYHLINTFFSYRDQFNIEGGDPGQGMDQRSASEMFKDPFRMEILVSPWTYIPIALTSVFVFFDYHSTTNQNQKKIAPLNRGSKAYLFLGEVGMYPFGSAAPEETFYRGFVQNEFYYLVRSPYFSIPMSSMLFALSHAQADWPSSFVSGMYQGMLAYKDHGNLSFGNAVHFWGVVVLGIEAYIMTLNRQTNARPASLNFSFTY